MQFLHSTSNFSKLRQLVAIHKIVFINLCYSTVTWKVLLNWPHSKLGQYCANSSPTLDEHITRRCESIALLWRKAPSYILVPSRDQSTIRSKCNDLLNEKVDTLMNQATMAGQKRHFKGAFNFLECGFWVRFFEASGRPKTVTTTPPPL